MAGFGLRVQMTGLEDLHARLENMKRGLKNKIVRGGLRKVGTIVKRGVKRHLRRGSGIETDLLRSGIDDTTRTYESGVVILVIGPRGDSRQTVDVSGYPVYRQIGGKRGKGSTPGVFGRTMRISNPKPGKSKTWPTMIRNPIKYAHLAEYGFTPRGGGKKRKALLFLNRGWNDTKTQATESFRGHVEMELEKYGM